MFLRDLTTQMTNATIAANSITGSASIKIGFVPDVSVTIVEESNTSPIPDVRIIRPVLIFCFIRAIRYATRQTVALAIGYRSSTKRGIVPPAFP